MDYPLEVGETLTLTDPATGQPVTVIVTAIEDGKATIKVVAPPDVPVSKVRDPEPPPRVIH